MCAEPTDTEVLQTELADLQQKFNLLMEENKELRNKVRRSAVDVSVCVSRAENINLPFLLVSQLLQYEPLPEEGAPQQPEGVV